MSSREDDWLNVRLASFEVIKKVLHVVSLVDEHWLLVFSDQELMLWVFAVGVRYVPEVLVAQKGMQKNVVELDKNSKGSTPGSRVKLQRRQCYSFFLKDGQVFEDLSVSF